MAYSGRRIGSIKTQGLRVKGPRDLSQKERIRTGLGPPPPPKPKYGNRKVKLDGYNFDSQKEATVYGQLRTLEKAGRVRGLVVQPSFEFTLRGKPLRHLPKCLAGGRLAQGKVIRYYADFAFEELDGGKWLRKVIDVKGMDTPVSRLKRALVFGFHGVVIEIV